MAVCKRVNPGYVISSALPLDAMDVDTSLTIPDPNAGKSSSCALLVLGGGTVVCECGASRSGWGCRLKISI